MLQFYATGNLPCLVAIARTSRNILDDLETVGDGLVRRANPNREFVIFNRISSSFGTVQPSATFTASETLTNH